VGAQQKGTETLNMDMSVFTIETKPINNTTKQRPSYIDAIEIFLLVHPHNLTFLHCPRKKKQQ